MSVLARNSSQQSPVSPSNILEPAHGISANQVLANEPSEYFWASSPSQWQKRSAIQMKLNGKEYTKNYLTHQDLLNGASISFKMDAKPNQQRGTKETDFPYSFSNEFKKKK